MLQDVEERASYAGAVHRVAVLLRDCCGHDCATARARLQAGLTMTAAGTVPGGVLRQVERALASLGEAREALMRGRAMGARYEAETFEYLPHGAVARWHGVLWEFLREASARGVDGRAVLATLGGIPRVELSETARGFFRGGF